jgi:hypothetical protein
MRRLQTARLISVASNGFFAIGCALAAETRASLRRMISKNRQRVTHPRESRSFVHAVLN